MNIFCPRGWGGGGGGGEVMGQIFNLMATNTVTSCSQESGSLMLQS